VIEEARRAGVLGRYYLVAPRPGDACGVGVGRRRDRWIGRYTPVRLHRGWREFLGVDLFDRAVAARMEPPVRSFVGFSGQALRSFERARALGAVHLELHAPTQHLRALARRYEAAVQRYGIERSWVSAPLVRKALAEYERADLIYVNSEYVRASFLEAGVPAAKLRRYHLRVDPRFRAGPRPDDGVFRVVYVGSLSVEKGVPVLLEAFAGLPAADAELTLVGGWATRGMRRYVEGWLRRDPRVRLASGDPLPHLQRADVYVHPSFQDGYGYAPMEALACGVPVVVTEDTGMKEHVREGENGFVVPTGSPAAIFERLEHLRAHPLALPLSPPDDARVPAFDAR
jgi:glycosyltransferase involved in cell wall biosynthesis